jgi:hypothetical protein
MRLKGDFDYMSVDAFDREAKNAWEKGGKNFLIDMSGVTFMSSVGIRSLHHLYDLLHPATAEETKAIHRGVLDGTYKAPHLKLLNPTKRVLDSLKLTSLDMYYDILGNEQEAIAAF